MEKHDKAFLKHDAFVDEVSHGVGYVADHKNQVALYGGIAVAVVLVGLGWYWWSGKQAGERQSALAVALEEQQATVGTGAAPSAKTYATQAEKDAAVTKAFTNVAEKYGSKDEGYVAKYYLGVVNADQGKFAEAEKYWQEVLDKGGSDYGSLARFALAQLYSKQGKSPQAETHLRYLVDHPTALVSKENAQIELAKVIAPTKPDEAKKILEPLRQMAARAAVSRWAINAGMTGQAAKP